MSSFFSPSWTSAIAILFATLGCVQQRFQNERLEAPENGARLQIRKSFDPKTAPDVVWQSTVALVTNKGEAYGCSGVFVESQPYPLYVTAKHCFTLSNEPDKNWIQRKPHVAHLRKEPFLNKEKIRPSNSVFVEIETLVAKKDEDIALLIPKTSRGNDLSQMGFQPILRSSSGFEDKEPVVIAGFGTTRSFFFSDWTLGVLRWGETVASTSLLGTWFEPTPSNTCAGDSGGPVYRRGANGQWELGAVTVFGVGKCGSVFGTKKTRTKIMSDIKFPENFDEETLSSLGWFSSKY